MPLSGPVITTDAVMSPLCLCCFSLIFFSVSLCVQLSDSGPSRSRSKREVAADGSTLLYPETQQSISIPFPRKETHLLVSEEEFSQSHKTGGNKQANHLQLC